MADAEAYNNVFGTLPWELCGSSFSPITRPRWFWTSVAPFWPVHTEVSTGGNGVSVLSPCVSRTDVEDCLLPGWTPCALADGCVPSEFFFFCLTKRVPRQSAGPAPRGIHEATPDTRKRWVKDRWAQAPYHYGRRNLVQNSEGSVRRLLPCEEEMLMQYEVHTTAPLLLDRKSIEPCVAAWRRQTLLGNSWHMGVGAFWWLAVVAPYVGGTPPLQPIQCFEFQDDDWESARLSLWEACPYHIDRADRDLHCIGPLGPDWAELNAQRVSSATLGLQHRGEGTMSRSAPLIPLGLTPSDHVACGESVCSPLDGLPALVDDIDFALRIVASKGDALVAWRRARFAVLTAICRRASSRCDA